MKTNIAILAGFLCVAVFASIALPAENPKSPAPDDQKVMRIRDNGDGTVTLSKADFTTIAQGYAKLAEENQALLELSKELAALYEKAMRRICA